MEQTDSQPSAAHLRARDLWREAAVAPNASNTAYYDLQEQMLRTRLLPQVGQPAAALDIGCGEGRFSLVIAEFAGQVEAFDLSPALIAEAEVLARHSGRTNIAFRALDLEEGLPLGPFDLVGCMGVFSTIIDDGPYRRLIAEIAARLRPGGHLVTKDTTIAAEADFVKENAKSVRNYRTETRYRVNLEQAGFALVERIEMTTSRNFVNHLYLWRRDG